MTNRKIRALVLAAMLAAAGCGGEKTPSPAAAPPAVPAADGAGAQPPAEAPGGGGGPVALEGVAEAERQFLLADKDPAASAIEALFEELDLDLDVEAGDAGPVVETNAEDATDVDQEAPDEDDQPDAAELASVKTTSTRATWFDASYMTDGNPNTAWAPTAEDDDRLVMIKLDERTDVEAIQLRVSPVGVVVDVEARDEDGDWQPLAKDLVPRYRELHWVNLEKTATSQLRLRFHGPEVLVSEVAVFGEEADEPTPKPTAKPTAKPTPKPTVKPSPTPTPTPRPSTTPTPTPTPSATATPTPSPTATPTPAATATPTPRPSATATPTPRPSATPTPTPRPSATATPTPRPSGT